MNLSITANPPSDDDLPTWHILTAAESGFSMLDIYAKGKNGLDIEQIRLFAESVNQRDEPGSLYPAAQISSLPCRFFREQSATRSPFVLEDFKNQIRQFLEANEKTIKARRLLIDFRVSPSPVPQAYISAVSDVLKTIGSPSIIEEVALIT